MRPTGVETIRTVAWALELGIRMVDTTAMYENEEGVCQALQSSGVPREQVFVTSKLDMRQPTKLQNTP
jgi:diketogulonate reductase-like aldo/keto reductase